MTSYDDIDFSPIQALTEGEVITQSPVRDIRLASGKVLALITLDNGRDHTRPPQPERSRPSASPESSTSSRPVPICRTSAKWGRETTRA
ncbi:MAG: 3-hydroxyacyl-CoA dehydrogenase [Microbacterium sp.]|nr:3-hydroxyacyl-CoA dehydrogenase [Microbacterium sp.]